MIRAVLTACALLASAVPAALAQAARPGTGVQQELVIRQMTEPSRRGPLVRPGWRGLAGVGGSAASRSDLDTGGDLAIRRGILSAGLEKVFTNGMMAGAAVEHEVSRYDFSGRDLAPEVSALEDASVTRFGVNWRGPFRDGWSWFGAADVTFTVAEGAGWDEGMTAGGLVSASRAVNDRFRFSLGVLIRDRLEEHGLVVPIPGIDWQISERLRLRTAQGLTLAYQVDARRRWTADLSAGFEGRTYRLSGDGPLPHGVAEHRLVPLLAGLRYQPNPGLSVRMYAGGMFAQRLEFRDESGRDVSAVDADPSAAAGVSASLRF